MKLVCLRLCEAGNSMEITTNWVSLQKWNVRIWICVICYEHQWESISWLGQHTHFTMWLHNQGDVDAWCYGSTVRCGLTATQSCSLRTYFTFNKETIYTCIKVIVFNKRPLWWLQLDETWIHLQHVICKPTKKHIQTLWGICTVLDY